MTWDNGGEKLAQIGEIFGPYASNRQYKYDNPWWRLTLENKGVGSGGTGYGWMW